MFRHSRGFLRLLGRLVLVLYFLTALLVLGVRYWLLPNIDQFRPYVAQQLSLALDTEVSVARVGAQWMGLNPSLALTNVVLMDKQGDTVFSVPLLRARLSWRSLLSWQPHFLDLEASGIDLTVRQDAKHHLQLLGQSFDLGTTADTDASLNAGAIRWLASQQRIILRDTVIRWVDETRDATPLVLQGVTLNIANQGLQHQFSLVAEPPAELGQLLDMRGDFVRPSGDMADGLALENAQGQLYFHVRGMQPLGWAPWVDMPQSLKSGQVSAQAWLQLAQGQVSHVTADVTVDNGYWMVDDNTQIQAGYTHVYLDGPAAVLAKHLMQDMPLLGSDAGSASAHSVPPALSYQVQARNLDLRDPTMFAWPLAIDSVSAQGQLSYGESGLQVQASSLNVSNADIDASLQGDWRQDDSAAGAINMQGQVRRASIAAIVKYLPNAVDADTRKWLAHGLAAGEIYDANLLLQGQLVHFPFATEKDQGNFDISGRYRNAVIDYLPTIGKELGWPAVLDMQGTVAMRRAGLYVQADTAKLLPDGKQPVFLNNVSANIANMAGDAVLEIDGPTQGDASAYLGLMRHSALGKLLDGVFDHTTATGVWQVPLSLNIPLSGDEAPRVQGHIQFDGGQVQLMPEMPPLQKLQGRLAFTEEKVSTSDLTTQFLAGPASIRGELGGKSQGLLMQGRSMATAWADYIKVPGMQRIQGDMAYRLRVQQLPGKSLSVELESDLHGLKLDFPEPLTKSANAAMPLHATWKRVQGSENLGLDIQLGQDINVRFLHKPGAKQGPYFYAGAIGVKQKPKILALGTRVDIQSVNFDADAWKNIVSEFSEPAAPSTASSNRVMFPDVLQLRLQAQQGRLAGLLLDELIYTVRRSEPDQWRVDISSSQTAGTLSWREARGKVVGAVQADFHRLSLGSASPKSADDVADENDPVSSLKIDDDLNLPAINMTVKHLSLYGRDVGELALTGVNQAQGQTWNLEKLTLTSPSAVLTGSGTWRLYGPDRGLVLDATMQFSDLGAYFDQLGVKDVLEGGQGVLKGTLEWRNMPWEFSKTDLNGKISLELDKGRFVSMGSRSVRLLELLSFQSFSRMARLDLNPSSLTKDGFPYDSLRGTLILDKGVASTHDYRIIGPVGTIVLDGNANLNTETLNAQAVVIPNLDVSGAAIAAGFAINPIVGIGTFLTQWLLKAPLAKAMTAQYHISGNWDAPEVTEKGAN